MQRDTKPRRAYTNLPQPTGPAALGIQGRIPAPLRPGNGIRRRGRGRRRRRQDRKDGIIRYSRHSCGHRPEVRVLLICSRLRSSSAVSIEGLPATSGPDLTGQRFSWCQLGFVSSSCGTLRWVLCGMPASDVAVTEPGRWVCQSARLHRECAVSHAHRRRFGLVAQFQLQPMGCRVW